ncbi:MAG: tape measure protein [Thermoplasmata archaeon]
MGLELAKAFVRVQVDSTRLTTGLKAVQAETKRTMAGIEKIVLGISAAAAAAGTSFLVMGIKSAAAFEQTTISFETMLGSISETKKLLADLTEFAALTPFEMPEIEQAARGLVQFGERGDELMETLRILGNAASGTNTQFGMVALVFNQIRGVGKLLTQDFRQLATRGILSMQDLADHFGVTTAAAQEMITAGKVGFKDVRDILKGLSEEGGRFFNLMEKQSRTLSGLISTLTDAFNIMARVIAQPLARALKPVVKMFIELTERFLALSQEYPGLVAGTLAMTNAVFALTAAWIGLSIASRVAGVSMKAALIGTGIGILLVALGALLGWVADQFGLLGDPIEGSKKMMEDAKKEAEGLTKGLTKVAATKPGIDRLSESLKKLRDSMSVSELRLFTTLMADTRQTINQTARDITRLGRITEKSFQRSQAIEKLLTAFRERAFAGGTPVGSPEDFAQIAKSIISFMEDVKSSIKTPLGELEEFRKKLVALVDGGLLPAEAAQRAYSKALRESPFGEAISSLEELREKVAQVAQGLTDAQVAMQKFAKLPGVTKEMADEFARLTKQLSDLEARDQITKSLRTPLEESQERVAKMMELFDKGLITPETLRRGLEREKKGLAPDQPEEMAKRFGIADFGKQIQNALLQRDDPQKKTAEETEKSRIFLGQIKTGIDTLNNKPQPGMLVAGNN